jgi:hypothetical protein
MDGVFTSSNLQPHPLKSLYISGAILTIPVLSFRARPCSPPLLPSSSAVLLLALVVGADTGEGGHERAQQTAAASRKQTVVASRKQTAANSADGQRRGSGWLAKEVAGGLGSSTPMTTLTSCRSRSSPRSSAPRIHHSLSSTSLAMHREASLPAMDAATPCSPLSRRPSQTPPVSAR